MHTSIPAPGLGALGAGRGGKDSVLARSLAKLGVGADDIAVISKHDTSTLANDPNETELHERLADSMGRSDGAPLFIVSQKSLTGHAKGGAAVFQMMGLCQILRDGVIPPNRSLDCVDDELASSAHFVWVRETLRLGDKFPLKAGLVTSLGLRPRVGSGRAGAPAGVPGRAGRRAARGLPASGPTRGCWPVSAGWPRRSPVARRCTSGPPTVGSTTRRRRSARRRRCCSTRRRGWAMTTLLRGRGRMTRPVREPGDMAIVGVGIDLVSIPDFAEQVDQPGTVFAETFTPGERRDAADKSSSAARHLAARWAAKEAVIKAWSGSRFAQRPVLPEGIHRDIEVITDMWGRPRVRLTGDDRRAPGRRHDPRVADPRGRHRGRGGHPRNLP